MKKHKLRPVLLLAAGSLCMGWAHAQVSANSSGGEAKGSGGTASYSIGQVFYTANEYSLGSVSQGIQHAYEIFVVDVKKTTLNISLSTFPNPTSNNLTVNVGDFRNEKLFFQLVDAQGKMLNNGPLTTKQTQINTSSLPSATYFLNISNQENIKVQSYKIIKN